MIVNTYIYIYLESGKQLILEPLYLNGPAMIIWTILWYTRTYNDPSNQGDNIDIDNLPKF